MRHTVIPILFLLFLSSCSFSEKNNDSEIIETSNQKIEGIILNNNVENTQEAVIHASTGIVDNELSQVLGESLDDVVDGFYSENIESEKVIVDWLGDSEKQRTTEQGDIIEFLDYCENLIEKKNSDEVLKFIVNNNFEDFTELLEEKVDIENIESIYNFFKNNDIKINSFPASYSIMNIYMFLQGSISYEEYLNNDNKLNEKSVYNTLYIDYLLNYKLNMGCKGYLDK